jgi:GNAT superfamily N-acetyltransferase
MVNLVKYDFTANPEYADQVIDALLAESSELAGVEVERSVVQLTLERSPHVKCLIYVSEGTLLGVVILQVGPVWYAPRRRCARDLLVWVAPSHRGGSTAVRIIRAIETWALEHGVDDLYLSQSTGIEVERTAEFYQRLGYTLSGFISHKRMDHVHRI